ncbi:hypothetical protein ECOT7509_4654 [Escherichia coli TW07509]|nr:hypothetical protein ECOT7509_4654 [Escherichia coli TW07509]
MTPKISRIQHVPSFLVLSELNERDFPANPEHLARITGRWSDRVRILVVALMV